MKDDHIHPAILHYDGPDSVDDEITEEHFRHAIEYIAAIFPPERDFPSVEEHNQALLPYDFDYRCAKRTLERYAIEVLDCDIEAMKACYGHYSVDPSFHKEGLPANFVSCILDVAWADIGSTMFIRVVTPSDEVLRQH